MASTTLYCSRADVEARLSEAGVRYVTDDDNDGVLDDDDLARVDDAINAAGAEIDSALCVLINTVPIVQDDGSRNQWLKDRAIDLACERLADRKGDKPPDSLVIAANRSRTWLQEVMANKRRVPGLTYPGDSFTQELRDAGGPTAVNPGRGQRMLHRRQRWWRVRY